MPQEGLPDRSRRRGPAWLSDLPSDWQVARLRHVLQSIDQGWSPNAEDREAGEEEWGVLKLSAISKGRFRPSQHKALPPDEHPDSAIEVRAGDVLVTRANTPQLVADVCFVTTTRPRLMFSDLVYRLRFRKRVDPRFATYWLLSPPSRHQIEVDAHGSSRSMVKVSQSHIRSWYLPIPPATQQRAIGDFLDRKTAQIDRLIERKERLIELLEEKRTALITRAVTKGLDPDVEMKDSGVEWLGEIPAHWELVRIKHLLEKIIDAEHKTAPFFPDGEFLVVRTPNVRSGRLVLDDAKFTSSKGYNEWTRRGRPLPGDIVFTREAPAGEACVVPEEPRLCLGQRTVLFRVNPSRLDGSFAVHALYGGSAREFIGLLSQGSTVPHFNMSEIGDIPLLLPPLREQQEIAAFLGDASEEVAQISRSIEHGVNKLYEYRSALISAAVTGKIDVRDQAA